MTHLPWGIPEEAVEAAARGEYEASCGEKYLEWKPWAAVDDASRERVLARARAGLEAALPLLQFSPLGDNHHNAAKCPHCLPELSVQMPSLVTEAARLAGRGMHPNDTVSLVRHLSGEKVLEADELERIQRRLERARAWEAQREVTR